MNFQLIADMAPAFARAALVTLGISLVAISCGALAGFALNTVRVLRGKWCAAAYRSYVWAIRGTPFLAQLFVIYFGLPQIGLTLSAVQATIVGLALYASAYFAEIFRSTWQAIPRGQIEAGRAFGLTRRQILARIEMPVAGRLAVPMLTNQAILVLKESSVASIITVPELTMTTSTIVAETFSYIEPYLLLGATYWLLASGLARLGRTAERRLRMPAVEGA